MNISIIFIFASIISSEAFLVIDEPVQVCIDGDRVNFAESCVKKEKQCLEELELLKESQDFGDFFFKRKGQRFHSLDDVIYTVKCNDKVTLIHLPEIDNGDFVNIEVAFINSVGVNTTGYLTQFDIISLDKSTQKGSKNHMYEFTLPSGEQQIIKAGNQVSIKQLSFKSEIIEFLDMIL